MIKGKELIKYLRGIKWEDIITKSDSLSSDEWIDFISRYISEDLKEIENINSKEQVIKMLKDTMGKLKLINDPTLQEELIPDLEDLKKNLEEIYKTNIEK